MATQIHVDLQRLFPREFVPKAANMGNWAEVEPLFMELLRRKATSVDEFEHWLLDYSELCAALWEESSRRYIAMTCQTDDPEREASYQYFVQEITPRFKPLMDAIQRVYLDSPVHAQLPQHRYAVLDRRTQTDVALYREQNVQLETEEELLAKDYFKIMGGLTISVNGKDLTLEQASKFLEEPDRALRQRVWEQIAARRLEHKDELDALFDRLVVLRTQIATNAGFSNYRDYMFPRRERFDYTPEDCARFHDGVERAVVPLVRKIYSRRQKLLGTDSFRPWDTLVDPRNRSPLRPFSSTEDFLIGTQEVFARVHPSFGEQFRFMADHQLLDVESRKGKAPGGYQSQLSERRLPFIFANAVGRDADLSTLMHEGGHAFHMLATRNESLIEYRRSPMEFAEVASMGMELLVIPHLGVFYKNRQDLQRALRTRFENVVTLFPTIAVGDAFQHWLYTHPQHTREQRVDKWLELYNRFNPVIDWDGYQEQCAFNWHRILHFFTVPFYFIDYGIAQIGALQVWQRSRKNYTEAVERYWSALALGGSRTLPELFAAAGAQFRFDYEALKPLMDSVEEVLSELDS